MHTLAGGLLQAQKSVCLKIPLVVRRSRSGQHWSQEFIVAHIPAIWPILRLIATTFASKLCRTTEDGLRPVAGHEPVGDLA